MSECMEVLIEPGTPVGFSIISHMRSYVLWMSNKRQKKSSTDQTSHSVHEEQSYEETLPSEKIIGAKYGGSFVVSPCPHDGACPLEKAGKYCHFVQRMERTPTQRAFKKTSKKALRGFEDEKFSFVVIRRGERPREPWPLDGLHFETLKEQRERHNKEDVDIDCEDLIIAQDEELKQPQADLSGDDSDHSDTNHIDASFEDGVEEAALPPADLGSGWGRIIFPPVRRGRRVCLDVCHSTKRDGSKGCLERLVVTRTDSPILHNQARKSIWGDLWPF